MLVLETSLPTPPSSADDKEAIDLLAKDHPSSRPLDAEGQYIALKVLNYF